MSSTPRELVVLLHGIGRTGRSLAGLEASLATAGYSTLNLTYPWRRGDIAASAKYVAAQLANALPAAARLHVVTHSMGGLVADRYLTLFGPQLPPGLLGRVVMLGPPLGGSEVADALVRLPPYHWLYGPAGAELTTHARAAAAPVNYPLGVIAGTLGWPYLLGQLLIAPPHDGRVAVARTRIPGTADHLTLPVAHSFMMRNPIVQRQTLHFLQHGAFAN